MSGRRFGVGVSSCNWARTREEETMAGDEQVVSRVLRKWLGLHKTISRASRISLFPVGGASKIQLTRDMKAVVKYEQLYLKPKMSMAVMIRSEPFIRSLGEQVKKGHVKQRCFVLCPCGQSIQGSSGFIS